MDVNALARELGLGAGEIEIMESGEVRIPSIQLARLARILDLPLSWFFAGLPGQDVFDATDARRSV